jgi:hypothetical protein
MWVRRNPGLETARASRKAHSPAACPSSSSPFSTASRRCALLSSMVSSSLAGRVSNPCIPEREAVATCSSRHTERRPANDSLLIPMPTFPGEAFFIRRFARPSGQPERSSLGPSASRRLPVAGGCERPCCFTNECSANVTFSQSKRISLDGHCEPCHKLVD